MAYKCRLISILGLLALIAISQECDEGKCETDRIEMLQVGMKVANHMGKSESPMISGGTWLQQSRKSELPAVSGGTMLDEVRKSEALAISGGTWLQHEKSELPAVSGGAMLEEVKKSEAPAISGGTWLQQEKKSELPAASGGAIFEEVKKSEALEVLSIAPKHPLGAPRNMSLLQQQAFRLPRHQHVTAIEQALATQELRSWQQRSSKWANWITKLKQLENGTREDLHGDWRGLDVSFPFLINNLVPPSMRDLFVLNVGGNDGKTHDPVYPLFRDMSYSGVVVEAFEGYREALFTNLGEVNHTRRVFPVIAAVPALSSAWGSLLHSYRFPQGFDALKIDIDSFDVPVLRAVLDAGFRPKVVMMEFNPDMPPPFQWYVDYDVGFRFSSSTIFEHGVYGGSPDALFEEMVEKRNYSFVAFEFAGAEHNMWFVREDILVDGPLVSWSGMVRWFWAGANPTGCMHMRDDCPRASLKNVVKLLNGTPAKSPVQMSHLIAENSDNPVVLRQAHAWKSGLQKFCSAMCNTPMSVRHLASSAP